MRVFSLDLLLGRTAQRWGVPGHAAGLLNDPKALWPHLWPPRWPAPWDSLQAISWDVLLPETAGQGSFTQPFPEPGCMEALVRDGKAAKTPLPCLGRANTQALLAREPD